MGVRERVRDLEHDAAGFSRRERSLPVESHREVFPLDQRHGEVHDPVPFIDAVDRDDVRVTQLSGGLRLAQESRSDFSAKGELRRQHLDSDQTLEAAVTGLVNDAHTTTTDLAVELVRRREDSLDVCSEIWVCRRTDWLGHAVGLAGYDDGA